ncbi:hypothetical protein WA556_000288 [Blastocystis sp. ATCC 50177/Nand II]
MERRAEILKRDAIVEDETLLSSLVEIRFIDGTMHAVEGVWRRDEEVLVEIGKERVIEVNVKKKELMQLNGKDMNGIERNQVLDLSDDGERWEGDVLNDEPYGWGVLYDSENRMAYEGFRIGDLNVCYGIRYYSDVGVMEYEGEWCEGKRWGRGIQYDRTGNIVYDGEWFDDEQVTKRVVLSEENQLLHNHIEELIVSNGCCNKEERSVFDLSPLPYLKTLHVGNRCFRYVEEVKLIGMKKLEMVIIGEKCFSVDSFRENMGQHFCLKNCERLRELKIGKHSFPDYDVCEIENNASLEVIEIGELNEDSGNFYYGSLTLRNLPSLKSLLFGKYSFNECSRVVFENLPELTSIRLGDYALDFVDDDDNSSELIMRNLPKLTTITTEGKSSGAFYYLSSITLENIPSLTEISLSDHALKEKKHVSITGSPIPCNSPNQ